MRSEIKTNLGSLHLSRKEHGQYRRWGNRRFCDCTIVGKVRKRNKNMHLISIVEDDVSINGLLKEVLEKEHYFCTPAFSGTSGEENGQVPATSR